MSDASVHPLMPDAPPADTPGAGRVLVVDDDLSNRDSLARRLRRRGYEVATAEDGPSGLSAVEADDFDVILLDVMMPGMSGLEVLARLRETRSPTDLPVIMATARDASADVVDALGRGANDYVTKPLDFDVVVARVQTQVGLRQSVRRVLQLEHRLVLHNAELEAANAKLKVANGELLQGAERTRRELELAARVQATFLPKATPDPERVKAAWRFEPCVELAGDALNICQVDAEHVGFYVLDVSGHGVASALTAVAAARLLAPGDDPGSILLRPRGVGASPRPVPPAEVAQELARRFLWDPDTTQFLTVFYGLLHTPTRRLTYVSAGHPRPIHLRSGIALAELDSTGLPIGVGEHYEQREVQFAPGDRLLVYSDGVTETAPPDGDQFGPERLIDFLVAESGSLIDDTLSRLGGVLNAWRDGMPAKDDVSMLMIECV